MTTTTHCGDSCGLIDFTMAVAGDRLLPEERMKLAIEAVTSQKMSQRGAATKYGVAQRTLSDRIKAVSGSAHHAETKPTTEVLPPPPPPLNTTPAKVTRFSQVRSGLRALLKKHGAPAGIAGGSNFKASAARGWLEFAEISIPPELQGKTTSFNHAVKSHDPATTERLSAHPDVPSAEWGGDPVDEDPIYAEDLDIDAVRDHVCAEIQLSDRPADFKRAIELLRELDAICTDAWYRRHPEPWNHHDWAHVNSELKTVQSLVGQRAEETADQLLFPGSAVTVSSAPVA